MRLAFWFPSVLLCISSPDPCSSRLHRVKASVQLDFILHRIVRRKGDPDGTARIALLKRVVRAGEAARVARGRPGASLQIRQLTTSIVVPSITALPTSPIPVPRPLLLRASPSALTFVLALLPPSPPPAVASTMTTRIIWPDGRDYLPAVLETRRARVAERQEARAGEQQREEDDVACLGGVAAHGGDEVDEELGGGLEVALYVGAGPQPDRGGEGVEVCGEAAEDDGCVWGEGHGVLGVAGWRGGGGGVGVEVREGWWEAGWFWAGAGLDHVDV